MTKDSTFNMFVYFFVILAGAISGAIAGSIYAGEIFSMGTLGGTILGTIGSYAVARLYLYVLTRMTTKQYSKLKIWFFGTLFAILCGILCTTFLHLVLAIVQTIIQERSWKTLTDGLFLLIIFYAELIGAAVGLILGVICSFVYVKFAKVNVSETA